LPHAAQLNISAILLSLKLKSHFTFFFFTLKFDENLTKIRFSSGNPPDSAKIKLSALIDLSRQSKVGHIPHHHLIAVSGSGRVVVRPQYTVHNIQDTVVQIGIQGSEQYSVVEAVQGTVSD
jgi:hypothetical protein